MSNTMNENVIEFMKDSKTMTVTFSQGRFISRVKELAEKYPDEIEIRCINPDGSIVAHMPVKCLHLSLTKKELSDEERKVLAERLKQNRASIQGNIK